MEIVLGTNNAGKVREINAMCADMSQQYPALGLLRFAPQSQWDIPSAVENGDTFVANALIKARHAARLAGRPALSDDSGIVVDALGGRPGIFSARFAGADADDVHNNAKLLAEMEDIPDSQRSARFVCALAFVRDADDDQPLIAEGIWEGQIMRTLSGDRGFGYDPLFYSPEHGMGAAAMDPTEKNRCSHRAKALTQMVELLANHLDIAPA